MLSLIVTTVFYIHYFQDCQLKDSIQLSLIYV
jgi:hypothetical protein